MKINDSMTEVFLLDIVYNILLELEKRAGISYGKESIIFSTGTREDCLFMQVTRRTDQ